MATGENPGVTISDLETQFNLTHTSLDSECTNEHACYIANRLKSWELLAPHLGLGEQQIEAIKRNNDSEEARRAATLTTWKESFAFKATNGKIIQALLAIRKANLASVLCNLLSQTNLQVPPPIALVTTQQDPLSAHQSPPPPSSTQTPLELTSPQSSCGISVGSPPPQQQITFPGSLAITKNPTVKTLKSNFAAVVRKVIELYTKWNFPLHKLKRIATHLTPDLKGELGLFFKKERPEISKAKSIDDLFAVLSDFWDYLQPDLLVYLVEQCEISEAKMVVSEYEDELAKCRQQITLREYIGKRQCNLDDNDRYQIAIRLGNEWHEKTLDDLEKMRFAFADEFSLLRLVLKLHGLKSGSITVLFCLPKSVVLNQDQLVKFFQSYKALQVMVDGVSVYDMKNASDYNNISNTSDGKELTLQDHASESKITLGLEQHTEEDEIKSKHTPILRYRIGSRDALFIVSSENLQGPDIVPRREAELTKEDMEKLTSLNISPEQWKDDASLMKARYALNTQRELNVVEVLRNTPEKTLTREYVLKRIEELLNSTKKQGVIIRYMGPGKRNTGDWCFEDGFITFKEIVQIYLKCFKGQVLVIITDCSYSGRWIEELTKFLDEQGVRPCGHSATEKSVLLKVAASCQPTEIPCRLRFSARALDYDVDTGMGIRKYSGFKVEENQHIYHINATQLRCKVPDFAGECALNPDYTWERWMEKENFTAKSDVYY